MSQQTPTTQALSDTIIAQLESSFGQNIPLLPKSFSRVLAKVTAAAIVIVYKYAGWILLQMFVAYATMRETEVNGKKIKPLVEWGRLIGVGDPNPATQAQHTMSVAVLNQTGSLAAGELLVDSTSGVIHQVVASVLLDAPTVTFTVRAVSDSSGGAGSGSIGNLEPGDTISFANTPPQLATDATVVAQTVAGEDAETEDGYRTRVIRRFQARPQGGAYSDYEEWATDVEGIAAAYPYTGDLPGKVDVYVEATPESSGSEDGIPTDGQITQVEDYINGDEEGAPARRPAGALVAAHAITRTAFDVTIVGLLPDTAEMRDAIEEGLDEYLRTRKPFIVGLSVLPRVDRITTGALSGIAQEIAESEGASITNLVTTPPLLSHSLEHGELAKLGAATWE